LNLVEALPELSWRRFLVLLSGLSGDSVYVITQRARMQGDEVIDDPDDALAAVEKIWG
jgi:hypothetical protein